MTQYCESVAGFWLVEPLNALTNLAFIIGAYFLVRSIRTNKIRGPLGFILTGVMIAMGLGSLVFHSYRSDFTLMLDVIPVYIFFILALYILVRSIVKRSVFTVLVLAGLAALYYCLAIYVSELGVFRGSLKYAFVFIVLAGLKALIKRRDGTDYNVSLPLIIFGVAVMIRSVDLLVCDVFPLGTHFIWHIGVALATYFGSLVILRLNNVKNKVL